MDKQIIKEKIKQAASILKEKNIDLWLIFVRESSVTHDPSLDMVVGSNVTWQSAFCINKDANTTAIIGSLEVPHMEGVGTFENVIGYKNSVKEPLLEYLEKTKPAKIAINYSTNSNLADGLTHGMYLTLMDILKDTGLKDNLISSEEVVAALRGRKSETETDLMKKAIEETLRIYHEVTGFIQPGKTEKEIAAFIRNLAAQRGYEMAWDEEHCPSVFTGPDTAGAHSGPTDRKVERGHILNMDFGIKYEGYCSDLQRTWYVLRDGEKEAPEEVMKGFKVIKAAIRKAKDTIKPGVKGWEVDDAARSHITGSGYEEYPHGLGHQVGRLAHDGGAGLFPRWDRYGNLPYLPLEVGQIFTIEPRLTVEGHGVVTIEEEIQITKDGAVWLSEPQEELYLIS